MTSLVEKLSSSENSIRKQLEIGKRLRTRKIFPAQLNINYLKNYQVR
jgi:hypothetical protein